MSSGKCRAISRTKCRAISHTKCRTEEKAIAGILAALDQESLRPAVGGRSRAGARRECPAARGKSRSDELAPRHGGLSARRFSRSAEAAAASSPEKAFLAPDPGLERSGSGEQRSTEVVVGSL